jgi:hypothetical protein
MGYDSFGLKIGIEGEREFKNALKEINQSFKTVAAFLAIFQAASYRSAKNGSFLKVPFVKVKGYFCL